MLIFKKVRLSLQQSIALGFLLITLLGTVLLLLPLSNRNGQPLPFADALLTAASAACVTGLVIVDTYSRFTLFDQLVIITLIQVSDLGFICVAIRTRYDMNVIATKQDDRITPLTSPNRMFLKEEHLLVISDQKVLIKSLEKL